MSQIIDRILRIAKSYVADQSAEQEWAERLLGSEDEDLKNLIDELNSPEPPTAIDEDVAEALSVFGLTSDATQEDIKSTYRKLMVQWHPDQFVNAPEAERSAAQSKARQINAAYIILKSYKPKS